ncbi:MAG: hypothetical protein JWQ16_2546, partial [Novosphingobium sp.]|nr:hypothetical protein [Novosphingobium sp.]
APTAENIQLLNLWDTALYIATGDAETSGFPHSTVSHGGRDWQRVAYQANFDQEAEERRRRDLASRMNFAHSLIGEAIASGRLRVIVIRKGPDDNPYQRRAYLFAIDPSEFASGLSMSAGAGPEEIRIGCDEETIVTGDYVSIVDYYFLREEVLPFRAPALVKPWVSPPVDNEALLAIMETWPRPGAAGANVVPIDKQPMKKPRTGKGPGRNLARANHTAGAALAMRLAEMGPVRAWKETGDTIGALYQEEFVKLDQRPVDDDTARKHAVAVRKAVFGARPGTIDDSETPLDAG